MRKIKLTIEYDGANYHGWQVQPNGLCIQEVLEKCISKITKKKTIIHGSGRTDAGVHAEAQVAHFSTTSKMTEMEFLMALNSMLPADIVIKNVEEVDKDFHAQKSAKRKIYRYTILNREFPSALLRNQTYFIQADLDLPAIKRCKKFLLGEHDFTSFRGSGCSARSPVREIYRIDIKQEGQFIHFEFEGSGFLKYMIRNIMGTLVEVGKGRLKPAQVEDILESRDRTQAGPTAPGRGLTLVKVFY